MDSWEQMNIFDYLRKPFKITNKIRLIELFGGIGSQAMALRNIGADFEHHLLVEFDPAPVKAVLDNESEIEIVEGE